MNKQAFFLNGVYQSVLDQILVALSREPGETFYLQPFSTVAIKDFREHLPTFRNPVRLYASTTDNLPTVSYCADIIGWADKTSLSQSDFAEIDRKIKIGRYDPGLYDFDPPLQGKNMINLLYIKRLIKLTSPFSVSKLTKISDGKPLSTNRTRSGGWSYVYEL